MSIETEITRIKTNIASAYTKAEEKGATLPEVQNSANLPATIESITGGGEEWQPQPDWWDIDKILEEDTEDYPIKVIALIRDVQTKSTISKGTMQKFKTSDGQIYTSDVTHTWDTSKDKECSLGYKTRYAIWYQNGTGEVLFNIPAGTLYLIISGPTSIANGLQLNYYNKFLECINYKNCNNLKRLTFGNWSTQEVRYNTDIFANLTSLERLFNNGKGKPMPVNKINNLISNIDFSKITNLAYSFIWVDVEKIDINSTYNVTNFSDTFSSSNIKKIQELDFNSATNVNNTFYGCENLLEILSVKNIKIRGLNFSPCTLLNRDTLIRILNALYDYSADTENTYTITLGATNLAKLTEEEIAIGTNKGWTIS